MSHQALPTVKNREKSKLKSPNTKPKKKQERTVKVFALTKRSIANYINVTTAAGEIVMIVAINARKTGTIATSTVVTTADLSKTYNKNKIFENSCISQLDFNQINDGGFP